MTAAEKTTENEKPSIVTALAAVMEDVRAVKKADRNNQQNYNFRGVDAVMNAAGPALRKHGVIVVPMVEEIHYRDVQTSTGKASRECTVKVRYRFHGPAGDFLDCVTPGESMDFGDKGAPKAMSVAFRIALLQALCLPTDDPEPDAATYERGRPQGASQGQGVAQQRQNGGQRRAQPAAVKPQGEVTPELEEALNRLHHTVTENGYTREKVGARFHAQKGYGIEDERDPETIERFRKHLSSVPTAELTGPAKAAG